MTTSNILPKVHIGEVVRNAVLFNPENSRERAVNSDMLINADLRVDVLLTSNPLFEEVRQRYTSKQRFLTQVKGIVAEVQQRIRRFSEGFADEE